MKIECPQCWGWGDNWKIRVRSKPSRKFSVSDAKSQTKKIVWINQNGACELCNSDQTVEQADAAEWALKGGADG